MDQLIKLIRAHRLTPLQAEADRLADEICRSVEPDLSFYVFSQIQPPAAEDILQETLKSIATSMLKFSGASDKEFWAWCYKIADRRIYDYIRKKKNDRLTPMPPEELWQLVGSAVEVEAMTPGTRLDLEYAMDLLTRSKPECADYLWKYFVFDLDYGDIAKEQDLTNAAMRMRIGRCLDEVRSLVA